MNAYKILNKKGEVESSTLEAVNEKVWNRARALERIEQVLAPESMDAYQSMADEMLIAMAKNLKAPKKAKAKKDDMDVCPQDIAKPYTLVKETKTITIGEALDLLEMGTIYRDMTFQRTPSHTDAIASSIIESVLAGSYIPPIALVTDTDGNLSIADGSSRLWDFQRFHADDLKIQKKFTFSDFSQKDQEIFLDYPLTAEVVTEGADGGMIFKAWNSAVSLSGPQKSKSDLGDAVRYVNHVADHDIWSKVFTDRMLQKDSPTAIAENIIAHLADCYAGTAKGLTKNLSESEQIANLDYARIDKIMDAIYSVICESQSKFNKYAISSLIRLAYADRNVLNSQTAVFMAATADLPTAGSNSPKTQSDFLKTIKSIINRQTKKERLASKQDAITGTEQSQDEPTEETPSN